jgi:hypothetical protein
LLDTVAGMTRIYVNRADNDVSDSSLQYCLCAWTSTSGCGAGLKSYVQGRASRHTRSEIAKAFNLSVIATRSPVVPFGHDSIFDD